MKKWLGIFLLVIAGSIYAAYRYVESVCFKPLNYQTPFVFELKRGMSAKALANELAGQGLVPHFGTAYALMRFQGYHQKLKAGEYLFDTEVSLDAFLKKLTTGDVMMHRVTLPEGLTTAQMLELIEQNKYLSGDVTEAAGEGELLPETYTFAKGESKNNIIKKAKRDMELAVQHFWDNKSEGLPLKDKAELLILASIIEKETGVKAERAHIASVFYNRLNKGMPLQTDPTVIYALTQGNKDLGRSLTRKDLGVDSPYNTYLYKGLPPTPICNPGLKALEAAAHPDTTPDFYFVADGKGGHRFAKTLAEHNQNIGLWLKNK
ncbi:MAG: endolytic transglycosylase MltG [Alphaproteobacteria bacterium]|nr:endolytic transglycosylase MltG [Alphaproteobacteria bacterium]